MEENDELIACEAAKGLTTSSAYGTSSLFSAGSGAFGPAKPFTLASAPVAAAMVRQVTPSQWLAHAHTDIKAQVWCTWETSQLVLTT